MVFNYCTCYITHEQHNKVKFFYHQIHFLFYRSRRTVDPIIKLAGEGEMGTKCIKHYQENALFIVANFSLKACLFIWYFSVQSYRFLLLANVKAFNFKRRSDRESIRLLCFQIKMNCDNICIILELLIYYNIITDRRCHVGKKILNLICFKQLFSNIICINPQNF